MPDTSSTENNRTPLVAIALPVAPSAGTELVIALEAQQHSLAESRVAEGILTPFDAIPLTIRSANLWKPSTSSR